MSPKKKIYFYLTIFGIGALILVGFFVYPLLKEIKKNSEDLISAKKELVLFETEIDNLEQFQEISKTSQLDLEKANSLFIDPKVPIDFIKFLEKIGEESGVSIEISPISIIKMESDLWPSIGFQIGVTTSFKNFLKFFEKIETASYLIETQNLNLKRLTEQELKSKEYENFSLGDVKGTLLIKIFTK